MKRAGFTLIEILIVVGIIAIMLASAVMSVASGRGAVRVKEATRGVMQLSRYASALALLRQRPVVVTYYRNGKVEVMIESACNKYIFGKFMSGNYIYAYDVSFISE